MQSNYETVPPAAKYTCWVNMSKIKALWCPSVTLEASFKSKVMNAVRM